MRGSSYLDVMRRIPAAGAHPLSGAEYLRDTKTSRLALGDLGEIARDR